MSCTCVPGVDKECGGMPPSDGCGDGDGTGRAKLTSLQHLACQKRFTSETSDSGSAAVKFATSWQVYGFHVPPASLHWASVWP